MATIRRPDFDVRVTPSPWAPLAAIALLVAILGGLYFGLGHPYVPVHPIPSSAEGR